MSDKPSSCTSDYWIYAEDQSGGTQNVRGLGPFANCGKWMIFEPFDTIDSAWDTIKKATEEGKLGHAAKVGTRKDKGLSADDASTTVMCIYTYDWTDEGDVMRVRDVLRELGFTRKLPYKSDADTYAGKYRATGHTRISKYYC